MLPAELYEDLTAAFRARGSATLRDHRHHRWHDAEFARAAIRSRATRQSGDHDQTVQRSATPTPLTRAGGRIVSLRMVRENAPRARK